MNVYHWILEGIMGFSFLFSIYDDLKKENFKDRVSEILWSTGIYVGLMTLVYLSSR